MPSLFPLETSFTTSTAAWVGIVGAALALAKQGYDTFHNRRRERRQIDEALNRQPLVKEQLELGNVGEAVKHLSAIIDQMAAAKRRDDAEAAEDVARAERRIAQLEDEVERERQERQEADERYETLLRAHGALETQCGELRRTLRGVVLGLRKKGIDVDDLGVNPPT